MGKLEDARRAVLRVLKRSGDEWVELSTLQKPNIAGERAQARIRELEKLGHVIENRGRHMARSTD